MIINVKEDEEFINYSDFQHLLKFLENKKERNYDRFQSFINNSDTFDNIE
jgi:hypothetical protein